MLYHTQVRVLWQESSYQTMYGVRAVSRKHALNKAVKYATSLPCYADREKEKIWVEAEVKLIDWDEYWNCSDCGGPRKGSTEDEPGVCLKCEITL